MSTNIPSNILKFCIEYAKVYAFYSATALYLKEEVGVKRVVGGLGGVDRVESADEVVEDRGVDRVEEIASLPFRHRFQFEMGD